MFPESENDPAIGLEKRCRVDIPRSVSSDLLRPKLSVRPRRGAVRWAAVPEAAIDKDCNLCLRERNIRATPSVNWERMVDAVAQTH